jgi:DNA polymerase
MAADATTAAEFVPASRALAKLRRAAADCHGCPLWKDATQTVFGAGPRKAELMLVGEQPGDREDIQGEPFVGPAGSVLAKALESAGIDAEEVARENAGGMKGIRKSLLLTFADLRWPLGQFKRERSQSRL